MSHHSGTGVSGEDGFSLVELLVVVIILGILAIITIPTYLSQRERAWTAELTSTVANVALAVEAEAASGLGGTYVGTDAAFADESEFDTFVLAALAALEGTPSEPVTYDGTDGSVAPNRFQICMEHDFLTSVSVTYDSDSGGLQVPADSPC